MFDRSLEERIEELEKNHRDLNDTINTQIVFTSDIQKQMEMMTHLLLSFHDLFLILTKSGLIDSEKYKEDYEVFRFHYSEAKGLIKEKTRERLDF